MPCPILEPRPTAALTACHNHIAHEVGYGMQARLPPDACFRARDERFYAGIDAALRVANFFRSCAWGIYASRVLWAPLIAMCITWAPQAQAPRIMAVERWPLPQGRADLRIWQRALMQPRAERDAVFVRALDAPARAVLARLGVKVDDAAWRLAHLDTAALTTLTLAGDGVQMRLAPAHAPQGRRSLEAASVPMPPLHNFDSKARAHPGQGVLVGIIDTGIDLTHKTFRDAAGRLRVVAVWDQDARLPRGDAHPGAGHYVPAIFGYGHACDDRALDAGTCTFGDAIGHGTHVASIAAGSDPDALGAAAAADIALVRSAHFTQLADAVAFLDGVAQARGQALVINISVGGHYGPHDGRTPLETYLGHLTGPGRIVVAAAGNDGDTAVHVALNLGETAQRVGLEHVPHAANDDAEIDFWLPKDGHVRWALELWEDGVLSAELDLQTPGGGMGHGLVTTPAGHLVADATFAQDWAPEHQLTHLTLALRGADAVALGPHAQLVLRFFGRGDMQGWVGEGHVSDTALRFSTVRRAGFIAGDSLRSITVPATAPRIITVGSYTVQTDWQGQAGGSHALFHAAIGAHSDFSSLGPTGFPGLTGYKPDLCAPGSMVVAARSCAVPDGPMTVSPSQMVMQGTSMAAPHVTGTIALMLGIDPSLDPHDVRRLLHATAQSDAFTQRLPNAAWGYGKLNAAAALAATTQAVDQGCVQARGHNVLWLGALAALVGRRLRRHATACTPRSRSRL